MHLSLIESLSPSGSTSQHPTCHSVWTSLTNAFRLHSLSVNYSFSPDHVGQLLTFTVPEVNQSSSCLVANLPFKPKAFVLLLVIMAVSTVGNVSVFVSLYSNRRRSSRVNFFIMHLALADLVVLLTPLVESVGLVSRTWYGGRYFCKVYRVLSTFGLYLSSFIVVSVAVDRYMAISRPLSIATAKRRGRALLLVSAAAAAACSAPQALVFDVYESNFFRSYNLACMEKYAAEADSGIGRQLYSLFAFTMMYGMPLVTIVYCYTRIVCLLSNKATSGKDPAAPKPTPSPRSRRGSATAAAAAVVMSGVSESADSGGGRTETGRTVRLRRHDTRRMERARMCTLKMTVIIVFAFLFCWAPHWIVTLLNTFDTEGKLRASDSDVVYMCLTFAFFNSALNPMIYGVFTDQCQQAIRRCRGADDVSRGVSRQQQQQQQQQHQLWQWRQQQQKRQHQQHQQHQQRRLLNPSELDEAEEAAAPLTGDSSDARLERNDFDRVLSPIYNSMP